LYLPIIIQMLKYFQIPFLRPNYKVYLSIALFVGACISFILIFFQPFGTHNFTHPHKNLILFGYGFVVTTSICLYFAISKFIIHVKRAESWTIFLEVLDLFFAFSLSILATYLYLFNFFLVAATTAILPIFLVFILLYFKWKDVLRSEIKTTEDNPGTITLKGANRSDELQTELDNVLFAKAQDNYVMLYLHSDKGIQRHILRSTLKDINEQLGSEHFIKAHRSYVVNIKRIKNIIGNKNKAMLEIEGYSKNVPVSTFCGQWFMTIHP